jgi:hypothetical protein
MSSGAQRLPADTAEQEVAIHISTAIDDQATNNEQ